jgi:predicted kinase
MTDTPGAVIIVAGPPGAGKSTVARLVADAVEPSVHLHTDDYFAAIRRGLIAPYLPAAERQNQVVVGVTARAAAGYAAGGYQVLADGVVGPWFIAAYREAAAEYGVPLHYVVLRPDLDTTLRRATARGPDALTDSAPIRSMHGQFTALGPYEPHVLDSTGLGTRATAAAVRHGVESGTYLLTS